MATNKVVLIPCWCTEHSEQFKGRLCKLQMDDVEVSHDSVTVLAHDTLIWSKVNLKGLKC